jgi:hypothetical protein
MRGAAPWTVPLSAWGSGANGEARAKVKVKVKRARRSDTSTAWVLFRVRQGSLSAALADEGLVNGDRRTEFVTVPVSLSLAGATYAASKALSYTAKAGRRGSAR